MAGNQADEAKSSKILPVFPLRTSGRYVIDANGHRVRLFCVNWYGAHLEQMVNNGLNTRSAGQIAKSIADLGFNCVRLPFSLDNIFGNYSGVPRPKISLHANPELQDLSPLEIFDQTIMKLTKAGLMVILNNHVSSSGWCCTNSDNEGLWYTQKYPEPMWLHGLGFMAARYRDNALVIGFDLRNELRPAGSIWPDWGSGIRQQDWSMAAVKGAERVVQSNDQLLIIVSGVYYSIFLCNVPVWPIHSSVPILQNRLVYTAHEYQWFNFHLVARNGIAAYFVVLGSWCLCVWFLVFANWLQSRYGCRLPFFVSRLLRWMRRGSGTGSNAVTLPQEVSSRPWRKLGCSCKRRRGCLCEVPVAALCTAACALLLLTVVKVIPRYVGACDLRGMIIGIVCVAFAPLFALVSLVLWMRAAVLSSVRYLDDMSCAPLTMEASRNYSESVAMSTASSEGLELSHHLSHEGSLASLECRSVSRRPSSAMILAPVRSLRSLRCLSALVAALVPGSLVYIWHRFGQYEAFALELDFKWGFLLSPAPELVEAAPVWLGEFGCQSDSLWWRHMLRYLREREVDFAYWSVNGEMYNGVSENFGIFKEDFVTIRHPWKLEGLQAIMNASQPQRFTA